MADRAVDLPKPNPDDDEDVVDWLSTARTLWARGERSDALVWLRRAAEAAAMAGQPFRASEIGMYVTALEETYGDLPAAPPPVAAAPPAPEPERRGIADTLVDSVEAFGALATEVLRSKMTSIEVELDDDTLIEETPAALKADPPEKPSRPRGVPPPPPPPKHASGNAPSAAAPSAPAAAPSAPVAVVLAGPPASAGSAGGAVSSGGAAVQAGASAPASGAPGARAGHEAKVIGQGGSVPPPACGATSGCGPQSH